MPATDLNIQEGLLLLALDDEKGKVSWSVSPYLDYALAGGVLAELALRGLVVPKGEQTLERADDASETESPILNRVLRRFDEENPPERVSGWVTEISTMDDLLSSIAGELVDKGILEHREGHLFLVFPVTRYPMLNATPEKELIRQIREAILGDGQVPHRLAVMIAIARGAHLLQNALEVKEIEEHNDRLQQIVEADHDVISDATVELIQDIERAMFVASSIPFMAIGRM